MNNLLNLDYNRSVSIDAVPENSICEDCRKEPAIHRCLVIGGPLHGETGLYCKPCAERYADHAERVSKEAVARNERTSLSQHNWWKYQVNGRPLSEQGRWEAVQSVERYRRHEEVIGVPKVDETYQMPEGYEEEIETFPQ